MLAVARERLGQTVRLVQGDVRTLDLGAQFDAVTLMFAVLGYQTTPAAVVDTLRGAPRAGTRGRPGVRRLVRPRRAALAARPPREAREVRRRGMAPRSARRARPAFSARRRDLRAVALARCDDGANPRIHPMHYFFPHELELGLAAAGFRLVRLGTFLGADRAPRLDDYTALVVAAAA